MQTSMPATQSPTRALAEFAAGLEFESIPPDVVEHAKLCLLDSLGCAMYGSNSTEARIVSGVARELSDRPESTIWGSGLRTSCATAALANGTMVDSFTLDDSHRGANLHPSALVVPPAIAMAERVGGVNGRRLLTSLVAGYETAIRVGMSTCPSLQQRGHHGVGSAGGFGAAASASRMLGLDAGRMVHSLGIVGSIGGGLMAAQYDSMVKRMHAGKAAMNGVFATLLASKGFTGISNILEAEYGGFCGTYADQFDLAVVTRGLGADFETRNIYFRRYSGSGAVMAAVDAIRELRQESSVDASQVVGVTVRAAAVAVKHNGWTYVPASAITAQSNISYGVAIALMEGDAFVDQYTEEKLRDPRVLDLTRRISVVPDEHFSSQGSKGKHGVQIELRMADGRTLVRRMERVKPVSAEEVKSKFMILAGKAVDRSRAERILEMVTSVERLPDVGALTRELATPQA